MLEGSRHLRGQACQRIEDRRQPAFDRRALPGSSPKPVRLALEQSDAEAALPEGSPIRLTAAAEDV